MEGLAVTWIDGFTAYLRMSPHTWTAVAQMLSSAAEKVKLLVLFYRKAALCSCAAA